MIVSLIWDFVKTMSIQKELIKDRLMPLIKDELILNHPEFKTKYLQYCKLTPFFLACDYALPPKQKLSHQERLRLTLLAFLSPLIDDLTEDEVKTNIHSIDPNEELVKASKIDTMKGLILNGSLNSKEILESGTKIIEVQKEAEIYQSKQSPGIDVIKELTAKKGAESMLIYRLIIDVKVQSSELEFLNLLGELIQLMDDYFDVYLDKVSGIKTVPNYCLDLKVEHNLLIDKINNLFSLFQDLNFDESKKKKFSTKIFLLLSRAVVSSKYLTDTFYNKNSMSIYEIDKPRKMFITDMEKYHNFTYYLKLYYSSKNEKWVFKIPPHFKYDV